MRVDELAYVLLFLGGCACPVLCPPTAGGGRCWRVPGTLKAGTLRGGRARLLAPLAAGDGEMLV